MRQGDPVRDILVARDPNLVSCGSKWPTDDPVTFTIEQ
jgi:hypothetical protein